MSFGSGSTDTTTTSKIEYTPEQKAAMKVASPILMNYLKNPPTLPNYSTVLPFNQLQSQAQQGAVNMANGPLSGFTSGMMDISNWLNSSGGLGQNPYMEAAVAGAARPLQENLTGTALPAIRSESILGGQYGGTRQDTAEVRAIRDTNRQIGDMSSKMYSDAYQQGLDRMVKNLALAPQTAALGMYPSQVLEGVGGQQYARDTAATQEQYNKQMLSQQLPMLTAQQVLSIMMGTGTGTSTTSSQPSGGIGSAITGGLGGAATFGGLSALPGLSALGGPWGLAAGAGLGALATLFS